MHKTKKRKGITMFESERVPLDSREQRSLRGDETLGQLRVLPEWKGNETSRVGLRWRVRDKTTGRWRARVRARARGREREKGTEKEVEAAIFATLTHKRSCCWRRERKRKRTNGVRCSGVSLIMIFCTEKERERGWCTCFYFFNFWFSWRWLVEWFD